MKERHYFLHIPKTAGSTINYIFKRIYGQQKVHLNSHWTLFRNHEEQLERSLKSKKSPRLVHGHFTFGFEEGIEHFPVAYFTLLRHPVARVVSGYKHNLRDTKSPFYKIANEGKIKDYLCCHELLDNDNGQIRRLIKNGKDIPFGEVEVRHLEEAKENLKSFRAVGFTEFFDASALHFKSQLDWQKQPYYWQQNRSKNKVEKKVFKEEQLIKQVNELDIQLYYWARDFFEGHQVIDPTIFQRKNRIYQFSQIPRMSIAKMKLIIKKGIR